MNSPLWQLFLVSSPFAILAIGLLILMLSRNAHNNNRAVPFAIAYGFGVSAWLASLIHIFAIEDTMLAHRFSFAAAYVLAIGVVGLALTFPNNRLALKSKLLLSLDGVVGAAFIYLILFSDAVIAPSNFYSEEGRAPFSVLGGTYLILAGLHMAIMVAILIYRYIREVRSRLYFNYVVLGMVATVSIAGVTNLLLPLLDITSLSIGGPIAALFPFVAVVYALGIGNINDFRFTVAQLLHIGWRLVLVFLFIALGYLLDSQAGLRYYSTPWLVTMVVVATLGVALTYTLGRRIKDVVDRYVVYSGQNPEEIRTKLIAGLSGQVELSKNANLVLKFIKDTIGIRNAGIVLNDKETHYRAIGDIELTQDQADILFRWVHKRAKVSPGLTILRSDMAGHHRARKVLDEKGIHMAMILNTEADAKGFYIFGEKYTKEVFTRQDLVFLELIAEIADLSISRALYYDREQAFNLTLQQKVQEATHKLQKTNDKLKALHETKDDFISMASHQLRTPLTSIKGYISMVLEGDAGEVTPLQKKLLAQAFVSSQRMVYLISDLLNVSRLRTGKFVIEPTPTHLATIAREEVSQLQETAKSRGIVLSVTHTDHFPAVLLDETKMRQVIMNFIDNAIYYTPEGGHISVNVVEKPNSIELTVVDDGMGVPKSDQPHLFTKFFRANNAKRARPDGTGLGLFMAKKVVMAQGGAIIFKSQEGKGSTFGFTFAKDKVTVVPHYKPGKKEPASLLHKPKSVIMS